MFPKKELVPFMFPFLTTNVHVVDVAVVVVAVIKLID